LSDRRIEKALSTAITPKRVRQLEAISGALDAKSRTPKPRPPTAEEIRQEQEQQLAAARQAMRRRNERGAAPGTQPEAPGHRPKYVPPWVRAAQKPQDRKARKDDQDRR